MVKSRNSDLITTKKKTEKKEQIVLDFMSIPGYSFIKNPTYRRVEPPALSHISIFISY